MILGKSFFIRLGIVGLSVLTIGISFAGAKSAKKKEGHHEETQKKEHSKEEPHKGDGHAVHWGYEGAVDPDHWGEYFPVCGTGKSQSPLDIEGPFTKTEAPLTFFYKESALKILNNGHTIQVNYDPGSFIAINSKTYDLIQFHFHRPSEEKINGKAKAMVAHFVHKSADGKLAVVGVLLEEGEPNDLIRTLWENLPKEEGVETAVPKIRINARRLMPQKKNYYHYMGSLTTPPCTEGVAFYILKQTVSLSDFQLEAFPFEMNARPVQPRHGRKILVTAP